MPTVFVTGANRGLGLEFSRQYLADGWEVFASCRKPGAAQALNELAADYDKLHILELDVCDTSAVRRTGKELAGQAIDVLVNNAGIFGPRRRADSDLGQTFGHLDEKVCMDVFRVNSVAPLMMAEALLPSILAGEQKKIVTISSILGSITHTEGQIYAYRMSKAAVDMAMASLAIDLADKGILVCVISPGWVKTDMGGDGADLTPEQSIRSVRRVIAGLDKSSNGVLLDYQGEQVGW